MESIPLDYRKNRIVLRSLVLSLFISGIGPTYAADSANGERLARRWCDSCHVVSSDQKGPVTEARSFVSIAKMPDFDTGKLALFLLDPHPKMPNMTLSRTEAADLAAHIASLK